jgi:dienelactone hydrolase
VHVISTETPPSCERRLIEYAVEKDERVRAYLCVPRDLTGRRPGVLVLHQTTPEGKRESVGLAGERSLAFAADLAERGYVTLAPDSITAGERIDRFGPFDTRGHYLRRPNLSAMGKMVLDARRAMDILAATDGVDPARLGAIGHSLGAEEALMLAAFDGRVRATVASCGFATFQADRDPGRWARDHWFSYMPTMRPLFALHRLPDWDWDDVVRVVAPRALYLHNTRGDQIFPQSQSAHEAAEAARPIWRLYEVPSDRLMNVLKPGGHAIADDTRADMYAWLDHQLQH